MRVDDCAGWVYVGNMSATAFPNTKCPTCQYDAGPDNGWFGDDPRCIDCRADADRQARGWTPENSLS